MTTAKDQIRGSKQPKPVEPPRWETKGDDALYQAYHQRTPTGMWFAPGNMRAFSTTIIDVWYNPTTTDYLFITHEVRRNLTQRNTPYHTLRHLNAGGKIRNLTPLESNYSTCSKMLTAITTNKSPLPEPT